MFEVKTNQEIGAYLKKLILSKYPSCRKFCIAYVDLTFNVQDDINDMRSDEIRKLTNRLSQICKGIKSIQTYDLPIFSELLDVSCEEMLSAGAIRKPISNRRTNYNIAFSKNKKDWEDYINREDCIAAYADEFGKTVVDYAIEFKNYKFLRFLMENGYIMFISDDKGWFGYNFGAESLIKRREYQHYTLEQEFDENMILRTQLISLALENNDDNVLEELRAREFPTQYNMDIYNCRMVKFENYYDENYIATIVQAKDKVFNYFCEEYYTVARHGRDDKYKWIFPFFGKMIEIALNKNHKRAELMLDIAISHNKTLFEELKKEILHVAKKEKEFRKNRGFNDIIQDALRDFQVNEEKNVVVFNAYYMRCNPVSGFVVNVKVQSYSGDLTDKIEEVNLWYNKIIDIGNYLIKQ